MKKHLLIAAAVIALSACAKKEEAPLAESSAADVSAAAAPSKSGEARPAPLAPQLAYRYHYDIETPAEQVRRLMSVHEAACRDAGPTVCQLMSQEAHDEGKRGITGELSLRATPAWLAKFRDGLADQAKAAGGEIKAARVGSDELTAQMIDTDAALKAKIVMRDRLQALAANQPGKLKDLLEIEQELARIQAEIDAARSGLATMRARVAMSEMTIRYATLGGWSSAWAPLGEAPRESADGFAVVMSALLRIAVWLSPWAVLVALAAFAARRFRRPAFAARVVEE